MAAGIVLFVAAPEQHGPESGLRPVFLFRV